jgi:hypothetical protein
MPVIRIYGLGGQEASQLRNLKTEVKAAVMRIEGLGVTNENQVSPFFIPDVLDDAVVGDVVVYIDLFNRPGRKPEVKHAMSEAVGEKIKQFFPELLFIEVLPQGYDDKEEGYWSWRKQE